MGRNNDRNIKIHNDKLHKEQDKVKAAKVLRKEKLKLIVKKFNENKTDENILIMQNSKFEELKNGVQEIIDLIVLKDHKTANNKLLEISEKLDDLLDHSELDEDLVEISKYQVLLNQLFQKINPEGE